MPYYCTVKYQRVSERIVLVARANVKDTDRIARGLQATDGLRNMKSNRAAHGVE